MLKHKGNAGKTSTIALPKSSTNEVQPCLYNSIHFLVILLYCIAVHFQGMEVCRLAPLEHFSKQILWFMHTVLKKFFFTGINFAVAVKSVKITIMHLQNVVVYSVFDALVFQQTWRSFPGYCYHSIPKFQNHLQLNIEPYTSLFLHSRRKIVYILVTSNISS